MAFRETIPTPTQPAAVAGPDALAVAETLDGIRTAADRARLTLRQSHHRLRVPIMRRLIDVRILAGKSLNELAPAEAGTADAEDGIRVASLPGPLKGYPTNVKAGRNDAKARPA